MDEKREFLEFDVAQKRLFEKVYLRMILCHKIPAISSVFLNLKPKSR